MRYDAQVYNYTVYNIVSLLLPQWWKKLECLPLQICFSLAQYLMKARILFTELVAILWSTFFGIEDTR